MSAARKLVPISNIEATIAEIRRLNRMGTACKYQAALLLARIHETKSWRDARDDQGNPFKGFGDFVEGTPELEFPSSGYAYMVMDVARTFAEKEVVEVGITKVLHIARASQREHARLLREAPSQTVEEVMANVARSIAIKGRRDRGKANKNQRAGMIGAYGRKVQRRHKTSMYQDALLEIIKVLEGSRTRAAIRAIGIARRVLDE